MHRDRGLCNSHELFKIIDRIAPEVIFEELSPGLWTSIYEGSAINNLETAAIKRYLQKHIISNIPIGTDIKKLVDKPLLQAIDKMFDVFCHNPEYTEISQKRSDLSERFGFPYLNSDQCIELLEHRHAIERIILDNINNEKLSQTYKTWSDIQDKRENDMIDKIYKFSDKSKYERALFLVGTEHRKAIMDKIPKSKMINKLELYWNFNFFH